MLLTSKNEMIRLEVSIKFVRPDWVQLFFFFNLQWFIYMLPIIRFCDWITHDVT